MKVLGIWGQSRQQISLFSSTVAAGFPSPSADYEQSSLDLTELLIKHPAATYIAEASGDSLIELGIFNGDLLIVDRALEYRHNSLVIAAVNGELCCKVLDLVNRQLCPANSSMAAIPIPEDMDLVLEGVVINAIRRNLAGNVRSL